jgi:hypothetical protein
MSCVDGNYMCFINQSSPSHKKNKNGNTYSYGNAKHVVFHKFSGWKSPTEKLAEKSHATAEHRKWFARYEAGRVALRIACT